MKIGRFSKFNLLTPTEDDITALIEWIDGSELAENTKNDYKTLYKTFVNKMARKVPKAVREIKKKKVKGKENLEAQILNEDDIRTLIGGCTNARDKLIISLLWETGARIDEIMTMNIQDIEDDVNGIKLRISGKTGPRKILIIGSIPYLTAWLSNHPNRNDSNAPLFTNIGNRRTGERMEYYSFRKMLIDLGEKVGMEKPLNPHHFRHSRGTWLANRIPESPLKKYMGWTPDSKQIATYVHLSGRDIDDSILKIHNMENVQKMTSSFTPIDCPRCGSKNPPDAQFCLKCSLNLKINFEEMIEKKTLDANLKDLEGRMLRMLYQANKKWYEQLGLDFESFCDDYYWKLEDEKKGNSKGKRYLSDGPFDLLNLS